MTKLLTILAPIGATLMLLFTALTGYRMLSEVGELMAESVQAADVTSLAPIGACGMVMFGFGIMNFTLLRRRPSLWARGLLIAAAIMLAAGAVSIAYGNWQLNGAFVGLATAEAVEPEPFKQQVELGKMPLLIGYVAVLIAAALVAWASGMMTESSKLARSPVLIAATSLLLLCLAAYWNHSSVRLFPEAIGSPQVEPARLASCVMGAIRSVFLLLVSMLGFSVATLLVALPRRSAGR
jgi:hypothetical protein